SKTLSEGIGVSKRRQPIRHLRRDGAVGGLVHLAGLLVAIAVSRRRRTGETPRRRRRSDAAPAINAIEPGSGTAQTSVMVAAARVAGVSWVRPYISSSVRSSPKWLVVSL